VLRPSQLEAVEEEAEVGVEAEDVAEDVVAVAEEELLHGPFMDGFRLGDCIPSSLLCPRATAITRIQFYTEKQTDCRGRREKHGTLTENNRQRPTAKVLGNVTLEPCCTNPI